jgi:hypothetical protein
MGVGEMEVVVVSAAAGMGMGRGRVVLWGLGMAHSMHSSSSRGVGGAGLLGVGGREGLVNLNGDLGRQLRQVLRVLQRPLVGLWRKSSRRIKRKPLLLRLMLLGLRGKVLLVEKRLRRKEGRRGRQGRRGRRRRCSNSSSRQV